MKMKTIFVKLRTLGLVMAVALGCLLAAPVEAQTDVDATIKAVSKVIRKHSRLADNFVDNEIYPKFSKNPKVLTGIAEAYFHSSDSSRSFDYISRALDVDRRYVPAYVLAGDIHRAYGDTLYAFEWYNRAIAADISAPEGYLHYASLKAKSNPDEAVNRLNQLLYNHPDYDIYLPAALIYDAEGAGYMRKAVKCFDLADKSRMSADDFTRYVKNLHLFLRDYEKADTVLRLALEKYPSNGPLNRFALYNNVALKKYGEALVAGATLFGNTDGTAIIQQDYLEYGLAYSGLKQYDEALDMLRECMEFEHSRDMYSSDRLYAEMLNDDERFKGLAMQEISAIYDALGRPDEAMAMYDRYMSYREKAGKVTALDLSKRARLYLDQAERKDGSAKLAAYQKAYDVYGRMAEISPENAAMAYYNRLLIAIKYLDPDDKQHIAQRDAEMVIRLADLSGSADGNERQFVVNATHYLASYYLEKNMYAQSRIYWMQLHEVDPDNEKYAEVYANKQLRTKLRL